MKKIFSITKFCFLLVTCLSFGNCKKKPQGPIDKSNIILYDKPLSVIQECIQGKWELMYAKGGFTGNYIQYYHDEFWGFKNNNIAITDSGSLYIDTTIQWKYDPLNFIAGQKTYTINYYDRNSVPYKYYVEGISNDTLAIGEYGIDGMGFFFIKSN